MKVKTARDKYYSSSTTASELSRKLGFAGLAAVWLFTDSARTASQNIADLGAWLIVAGVSFVSSLGLDLLHYASASAMYGGRVRLEEKETRANARKQLEEKRKVGAVNTQDVVDAQAAGRLGDDIQISVPAWTNWPALFFFWTKQVAVIFGYIALLVAILLIDPAMP